MWTPSFSPDLTLTLDYFNIKIDNAIQRIDGSTKLATCYDTPGLAQPFCSRANFTRNRQTGETDFLSSQPVNAATERLSGVDLGALYQFTLADWNATLNWDVSYLRTMTCVRSWAPTRFDTPARSPAAVAATRNGVRSGH